MNPSPTLNIPLINCEIELFLTWSKSCALADVALRAAGNNNNPSIIVAPTGLEFQINRHKIVCSSCYFVNRK